MAKSRFSFSWRLLFLLPIPVLWCVLSQRGSLQFLENKLLDLSFRYRREIASPVKLVYVDLDTRGLQEIGERPWDREKFGLAAAALIEAGGAKAVAFDFVFSALSYSALVEPGESRTGKQGIREGHSPASQYPARRTVHVWRGQDAGGSPAISVSSEGVC